MRNHTQFDQQQRVDLFRFLLGFLQKKEHFIEYLVLTSFFGLKGIGAKMLDHFRWAKRKRWQFVSLKVILRPILSIKHWTYTYRRWNMYCIERITHLRIPISYILAYFFHIFAPTTKALFNFFIILKKTVGLLWNSVTKLIQLSILLFHKR